MVNKDKNSGVVRQGIVSIIKYLFMVIAISPCAKSFDKGADLFIHKDYLGATHEFLLNTPVNDPRVPSYIHYMSEKNLINLADLGEPCLSQWNHCLEERYPFVPFVLGGGNTCLEMSLLAQGLYSGLPENHALILETIKQLSSGISTGYGHYICGVYLENSQNKDKETLASTLEAYKKGADYAHGPSIGAFLRLLDNQKYKAAISKRKLKKYKPEQEIYVVEREFLNKYPSYTDGARQLSLYYGGLFNDALRKASGGKISGPLDENRKSFWQLEAARYGSTAIQMMLFEHSPLFFQKFLTESMAEEHPERWLYFAGLGGETNAQVIVGHFFSPGHSQQRGESGLFLENGALALKWYEMVIDLYLKGQEVDSKCVENIFVKAATLLELGDHLPGNKEQALYYYKEAADRFGNADACYNTAIMLQNGIGAPKNEDNLRLSKTYMEKAFKLLSGSKFKSEVAYHIGGRHAVGFGPYERSLKKAVIYLEFAASINHAESAYLLSRLYSKALPNLTIDGQFIRLIYGDMPLDTEKAYQFLMQSAHLGHSDAQQGWVYHAMERRASLSDNDARLLVEYLEQQSSESANAKAWLAMLLFEGYRDVSNKEKALELFTEASESDQENALHYLGCIYERGECGVEASYSLAEGYYKRSLNISGSLSNLGYIYQRGGYGVVKDPQKAIDCFNKALEMNYPMAAYNLGCLYQTGDIGIELNHNLAFEVFERGHKLGDPDASYQYALYLLGAYTEEHGQINREQGAEILRSLSMSIPDARVSLAILGLSTHENLESSLLALKELAESGRPLAQYVYGLYLYWESRQKAEIKVINQAKSFIAQAAEANIPGAKIAERLLSNRNGLDLEEAGSISGLLLGRNFKEAEEVRETKQAEKAGSNVPEASNQDYGLDLDNYNPQRKMSKALRHQKLLDEFLDHRNTPTLEAFYKIVKLNIASQGGTIKSANGSSGVKVKVGDEVLSFHKIHGRDTQLDEGRANALRDFAQRISVEEGKE